METLTPPKTESLQPNHDIEMQIDGMTVAYHQNPNARRTEYSGSSTAVIDSKEQGAEDILGSFEMDDISLPVVAKFTVENKPESYTKDAAPESEFLVVDIRGLGMSETLGTSVSGFKMSADVGQRFGGSNRSDDAPQFALVNLTSMQRRSREGGSMFSISTISRDPENPTTIRRDHTLHGEATVDSLSSMGLGESNVTVTSDENGKIIVSMSQESNTPIQIDTTEPLGDNTAQNATHETTTRADRLYWEKALGESALYGLFASSVFNHYKTGYDRSNAYDFNAAPTDTYDFASATPNTKPAEAMDKQPLQTAEDVRNRIADLRREGVSDKQIKKDMLKDLHPDFNPGVDPELAKVVTNEFRPQPQEYRNSDMAPQPASEPVPSAEPTPPASGPETPAAPTPSAEVVPVAAPAPQSQPSSGDFTKAA